MFSRHFHISNDFSSESSNTKYCLYYRYYGITAVGVVILDLARMQPKCSPLVAPCAALCNIIKQHNLLFVCMSIKKGEFNWEREFWEYQSISVFFSGWLWGKSLAVGETMTAKNQVLYPLLCLSKQRIVKIWGLWLLLVKWNGAESLRFKI